MIWPIKKKIILKHSSSTSLPVRVSANEICIDCWGETKNDRGIRKPQYQIHRKLKALTLINPRMNLAPKRPRYNYSNRSIYILCRKIANKLGVSFPLPFWYNRKLFSLYIFSTIIKIQMYKQNIKIQDGLRKQNDSRGTKKTWSAKVYWIVNPKKVSIWINLGFLIH